MKVRLGFTFEDDDLRRIRAGIGRAGKATRKECTVFADRAVRKALKDAPDAKPKRKRAAKSETFSHPCACTEETKCDACKARAAAIVRAYGHEGRA